MKTRAVILALGLVGLCSASIRAENYVVLYPGAIPAAATRNVERAGGSVAYAYPQIGVVIARSDNASFANNLRTIDKSLEGIAATSAFKTRVDGTSEATSDVVETSTPVNPGSEPLWGLQWDMRQIGVQEAHAITGGSPSIVVGDLDTGLDYTHPDLAPNVDVAKSVSCIGGVPNTNPAAWDDFAGHGTHTAGTIAAAVNGIGITGVAPNVRLAVIKAGNDDGFFFPEAVICGFVWAGDKRLHVTNNSYFADPWLFNCRNDPQQRAIWKAERRAIAYAQSKGVIVVAAAGNQNQDLSKTNIDAISPDYPSGSAVEREVTNACAVIPVEVPGVIGVSADGNLRQKSYYSSYGVGAVQLVAPGGDARFQLTAEAPNGRVLSTWPARLSGLSLTVVDPTTGALYRYLQGTSMASPHVAGVAALILSERMLPAGAVTGVLNSTAKPIPCPENPFNPGPPFNFAATCAGGNGYNGFYGHGEVDAHAAVSAVH